MRQQRSALKSGLFLAGLLIAPTLSVRAEAQSGTEKIVATVNGDPILFSEFVERIQRIKAQDFIVSTNPLQVRNGTAGQLTLDALISERLILQWGARTKDVPSDAEVSAEAETQKRNPQIAALLANGTLSETQLQKEMKIQLTRYNIATASVSVTPQDMEDYYKKNITRFTVPERWGLSSIRTGTLAKAEKATAELKKGIPFGLVVKSYSEDPVSKARDGQIGIAAANDPALPETAKVAIRKLKIGEVTPPVAIALTDPATQKKTSFYYVFRLTSKEPGQVQSFASIQPQLKRTLALERAGGIVVADKKIADYRQTSKIEISLPGYAELVPKKP